MLKSPLNLCGQHFFAQNTTCVTFFGTLEVMYMDLQLISGRYWKFIPAFLWNVSAKKDGVLTMTVSSQIADNYVDAIKELIDVKENFNIAGKPQSFLHIACIFSFLCHIYFWADVWENVDQTKQYLQTKCLFTVGESQNRNLWISLFGKKKNLLWLRVYKRHLINLSRKKSRWKKNRSWDSPRFQTYSPSRNESDNDRIHWLIPFRTWNTVACN